LGEPWVYLQLGWGGILGAYFGMQTGIILGLVSTATGVLLISPLLISRWQRLVTSLGPIRLVFYLVCIAVLVAALALKWVD
jgi:hypothetical protein